MRFTLAPEEKILVARCRQGDKKAQQRLYRKYVQAMYNTVIRMVPNKMDTEDIVQDSFVKVFRSINNFKGDATLGAWIKRITINTTLNFIRKNSKVSFTDLDQSKDWSDYKEKTTLPVKMEVIHYAIQQLPEGSRIVFSLHLLEGYQHKEIAHILGISESTSKSQYQRARRLLQQSLKSKLNY